MSKDQQKPYDAQTARFLSRIAECMPYLSAQDMQTWIEHPKFLKQVLSRALSDPWLEWRRYAIDDPNAGSVWLDEKDEVPLQFKNIRCNGENPFVAVDMEVTLEFGLEYEGRETKQEILVRPWLIVWMDPDGASKVLRLRGEHVFRGMSKHGPGFSTDLVATLLASESYSLSRYLDDLQVDFVANLAEHIRDNLLTNIMVDECEDRWIINFALLTEERVALYTTRFHLMKKEYTKTLVEVRESIARS